MNLKIDKPIIFFDLETTGINVSHDRIVEISILKVKPDGSKESRTYRVNPQMPIPAETSKIHGIYDEDVVDEPCFDEIGPEINDYIAGCHLAGFNSNRFDIPLLAEEFLRIGIDFSMKGRKLIDVQTIFHKMEQRTLSAAYKFYCDKELVNAHSAKADTEATYEILEAQLDRYQELNEDIDSLHEFTSRSNRVDMVGRIVLNKNGKEVFNFGKHKGKKVIDVLSNEPGYYSWMMKGDFPLYTKKMLTEIKERG